MALSRKAGQWKTGTGAGTTTVITTGFEPKAILQFGTRYTGAVGASGTVADLAFGVGFASSTSAYRGMAVNSQDALGTTDAHRSYSSKGYITVDNTGSTDSWECSAITSTSFSMYSSGTPSGDWLVNYLAIGGSDITNASAFEFTMPGTSGAQSQSITTPGFRPDVIFLCTIQKTNAPPINDAHATLAFGWAAGPSDMGCWTLGAQDAVGAANTFNIVTNKRCLATINATTGTEKEAMLLGFTATGFDLRWVRKTDTAAERVICLAIQGGRWSSSTFSIPASGTSTTFTGAGFTPSAALYVGGGQTAVTSSTETDYPATSSTTGTVTAGADCDSSFGVSGGTGQELSVWVGDDDGADPTTADSYQNSSGCYTNCALGSASVESTLSSVVYNSDGASFTMTASGAVQFGLVLWIAASADTASADTTTLAQMQADGHPPLCAVLEIEGYPYLLYSDTFSGYPINTAAVLAAYSATEWTQALSGLAVPGSYSQEIVPFDPQLTGGSMLFTVHPTDDATDGDRFGIDTWAGALSSGKEGFLQAAIDSNDLALTLDDADEFATSGALYIGTERLEYSSRDTGTEVFTISKRGTYAPWKADTETLPRFGRPHRLDVLGTARHKPLVTDYPRLWAGRWVRLNIHTVQGGALNSRENAFKAFGGRIESVRENGDGSVSLSCSDAVSAVGSAMLFTDQFRARVRDGIYLSSLMSFDAYESWTTAGGTPGGNGRSTVTGIDVKTGASGANEIEVGYYTVDELLALLNRWLASEAAAGRLDQEWALHLDKDPLSGAVNTRVSVRWRTALGGDGSIARWGLYMPREVFTFLGFSEEQLSDPLFDPYLQHSAENLAADDTSSKSSAGPPLKALAYQEGQDSTISAVTLSLDEPTGTWIDQQTLLPDAMKALTVAGESWGVLRIGGRLTLAKRSSDTSFVVVWTQSLSAYLGDEQNNGVAGHGAPSLSYGDAGQIEVEQVLFLQAEFKKLILWLICSTGTSGYNHATWDALAGTLTYTGLPWELLDDRFEASVAAMASLVPTAAPTMIIDKPTRLGEKLLPELQLRNAHLVWDQGLVFVMPSTAQGTETTFALVDVGASSNKVGLALTRPDRSTEMVVTGYKVLYNPGLDGEYRDPIEIRNGAAESDMGGSRPITVKAANTFHATSALGDTIRDLVSTVAGTALSIFAWPQIVISRTYGGSMVNLYPGAEALVTDGHVRDPLTGLRGITSLPAWVLSTSWDWRAGEGQLTAVIIGTEDVTRRAIYSPCADIDETAGGGGYDGGTKVVTCKAHSYSASTGTADAAEFPATHVITVTAFGDDFTAVQTWDDTVAAQSGNTITLTTGLAGFTAGRKYRITSRTRASAIAAQQTDAYYGDSADGKISGSTLNRRWSSDSAGNASELLAAGTPSTRYEPVWTSGPDHVAEAMPVNPGVHRALARSADNFISYKTAPSAPFIRKTPADATQSSNYALLWCFPWYVGRGDFVSSGSYIRKVYCAPLFYRTAGADSVYVRVTSSQRPPSGSSLGADGNPGAASFAVPYSSVVFTSTATTYSIATRSSCRLVADQSEGITWITVEAKVQTAGATVRCWGLPELWLGPLEAP